LKSSREREAERKKEEKGVLSQIAAIERAAQAAMVATPHVTSSRPPSAADIAAHSEAAAKERAVQCQLIEATVEAAKRRRIEQGQEEKAAKRRSAEQAAPKEQQSALTVPAAGVSAWTAHRDPNSGQSYYYNPHTGESRWQMPPELEASSPSASSAAASQATVNGTTPADAATSVPSSSKTTPAKRDVVEPVVAASAASAAASTTTTNSAWTSHRDPTSGQTYFYNASTGESRWQPPEDLAASAPGGSDATQKATPTNNGGAAGLSGPAASNMAKSFGSLPAASAPAAVIPDGNATSKSWAVVTDPVSGRVYYHNSASGISQWERPSDFRVDVSSPPPPPSGRRPPPPPPRNNGRTTADVTVGGWVEVRPEESQWSNGDRAAEPDSDDEEAPMKRIVEMKGELMARAHRRGELADEDFHTHEREMRLPQCTAAAAAEAASDNKASFRSVGKRAGIRRRGGTDD